MDAWGRNPVVIAWFALALLLTPVLFPWTHNLSLLVLVCAINTIFSLGQYTWCWADKWNFANGRSTA